MQKKRLLLILSILVITFPVAWWLFLKYSPDHNINPFYCIPDDAIYVLESDDPVASWNGISKSLLWQKLKEHPYFDEITADANYLDSLLLKNKRIFNWLGDRETLISAHPFGERSYDFLFTVKVEKALRNSLGGLISEKLLKAQGFRITERTFMAHKVIEVYDSKDRSTLYLSVVGDFLICSYRNDILEKSITASQHPHFALKTDFIQVFESTPSSGKVRLYIQYALLDVFLKCYIHEPDENIKTLSQLLGNGGYALNIQQDDWYLKGNTSMQDSIESYLAAFLRSGKAKRQAQNYISNRSAVMIAMGFESFDKFHDELLKGFQKKPDQLAAYEQGIKQIEQLLNIHVKDDLLGWIGNEIAFTQMRPSPYSRQYDDVAVFIKATSEQQAKEKLGLIDRQIKKRTPAKIKSLAYKNHQIHYLDIKGFFRLFFGKLFSKMERPYYVIVDDWVIFSQSPRTLIGIIEDIESGRTLNKDETYQKFEASFSENSALSCFVRIDYSLPLISKRLDPKSKKAFSESTPFLGPMKTFGMQLSKTDALIDTRLFLGLSADKFKPEVLEDAELEQMYREKLQNGTTDGLSETERFIARELNDNELLTFFPGTNQMMYRVEIKNEKLHGIYEEFYRNGQLKIKGKYRKGLKSGRWIYYSPEGRENRIERY